MTIKLSTISLHPECKPLLIPNGAIVDFNWVLNLTKDFTNEQRDLFAHGWNSQVASRTPDLAPEQNWDPFDNTFTTERIRANYQSYSKGFDAAVTVLSELWEQKKKSRHLHVTVLPNGAGEQELGMFRLDENNKVKALLSPFDVAKIAGVGSVEFKLTHQGVPTPPPATAVIDGQAWREMNRDPLSLQNFYRNVLQGTSFDRALLQAGAINHQKPYEAGTTGAAFEVANRVTQIALQSITMLPMTPINRTIVSSCGGASAYLLGAQKTLEEAALYQSKNNANTFELAQILRDRGYDIGYHDHAAADILLAVKSLLEEHDSNKQRLSAYADEEEHEARNVPHY